MTAKRFQVALSFPGEHRDYVSQVADGLALALGRDRVFYDRWYTAELAQVDMDVLLQSFYHEHAELIVPFLCVDYERKEWCGLEWRAIKDLIKQKQHQEIMPMRFDNTPIPGFYGTDGYVDLNDHTPAEIVQLILQRLEINRGRVDCRSDFSPTIGLKPDLQSTPTIHSDRLPTVKGGFFGREAELKLLNDAWHDKENPHPNPSPRGRGAEETRIIQFIAPGGTGKTKLLRHWIDHTAGIDALIAWSFYSQGASEDKQTSATPFFSHAFEKLGSTRTTFATDEDKGEHLAELLRRQRCVLVLDGLEPLQHAGSGMRGELKDRAIRQLLKSLAGRNNGLCIITTRIAVHELADRAAVISHDLQNLAPADGVKLLQSLGVQGKPNELDKAVREYGCHALALTLLGNVLRLRYQGDVQRRDTLKALVKSTGSKESRHAFKVMQAYEDWFAGQPELALLHLLGLFDHPIEQAVLQVLWDAQIPHLTAGIDEDDWLEAIAGLREEHHLLSQHDGGDLDCHPLIREYFGKQLQTQHPDAWQQAHARLYDYYKDLPEKELPDTLEEMQPLFSAVAHGCAAGLHQQAAEEVYWPRISRKNEFYSTAKLGAFSDDLATVAHFFTTPWQTPAAGLTEYWQAGVLNWAGFRLRALGRLREAVEPMQAGIDMSAKQEDWKGAAQDASNLSELQLTLGDLAAAVSSAAQSVAYADKSGDMFQRMSKRTTHADALHQAGQAALARELFQAAEALQQEHQPGYPRLYSLQGFQYCDLLLAQGGDGDSQSAAVLERYEQWVEWRQAGDSLLSRSLEYLIAGRAHLQQLLLPSTSGRGAGGEGLIPRSLSEAEGWLEQAVAGLRAAGYQEYLPLGLLARAALHRHTHDFARARQDLQEVFDIAEPSGMRLHLTDYHLEMARLLVAAPGFDFAQPSNSTSHDDSGTTRCLSEAEGNMEQARCHVKAAAKLINETGYHRRDAELVELQQHLA
ncbi:TIR domain-containing protein [Thiothrix sp.]|jgi:tetratricopeptide (TPR) repeat protein|uniref:TIR domain-containing protein n=1 Tax=Thiothrix sp. TaxID=1032 RepID=UPI00257E73B4|nr:TIR domain-containing protein [Thiothrix sp.]